MLGLNNIFFIWRIKFREIEDRTSCPCEIVERRSTNVGVLEEDFKFGGVRGALSFERLNFALFLRRVVGLGQCGKHLGSSHHRVLN